MNNGNENFPSTSCRIVDVVALDRDGSIDEYDLLTVIDNAITKYPFVRVWNLSLGRDTPCVDDRHSPLGSALDERMKTHDIVFVCAAGNYETTPLRNWPPDGSIASDEDRICPPADALRGVTVGGIAHLDNRNTCVRQGEPSPFTRRGPAPSFGIKPEVAYPAGNCDKDGRHTQTGIVSIDSNGNETESVGTSYATPLASSVMANLISELTDCPVCGDLQ
ncbi:S8 family serine peptidase [Gemmata massiliana]|uniref:S8 family serine peptidase n=1 Tax=Gemmata massiliana TaxID=1210884 RepID=UPI0013A6FE61|nr:S8 family serine peptidase [Gemmata massiliana]